MVNVGWFIIMWGVVCFSWMCRNIFDGVCRVDFDGYWWCDV